MSGTLNFTDKSIVNDNIWVLRRFKVLHYSSLAHVAIHSCRMSTALYSRSMKLSCVEHRLSIIQASLTWEQRTIRHRFVPYHWLHRSDWLDRCWWSPVRFVPSAQAIIGHLRLAFVSQASSCVNSQRGHYQSETKVNIWSTNRLIQSYEKFFSNVFTIFIVNFYLLPMCAFVPELSQFAQSNSVIYFLSTYVSALF